MDFITNATQNNATDIITSLNKEEKKVFDYLVSIDDKTKTKETPDLRIY
jgi:hypothetical protein